MGKILRNAVKCNYCGDIIESQHRHDFVRCSCGRVAVDGVKDYQMRVYHEDADFTELSEEEE